MERSRLNLLVVEDDLLASSMIRSILGGTSYHCHFVDEAEDGINYLKERNPVDIILLDYHLPKMNGKTFCQIVRSLPEILNNYPNLWIIAHTSERRVDLIKDVFDAGANDYLPKPIVPQILLLRLLVAEYSLKRELQYQRRLDVKQKLLENTGELPS